MKLMEGMQEMQKSLMTGTTKRGEEAEFVRGVVDLPKLPEWQQETSPIDFNDWVLCLHAHMSDLSATSQDWWEETLQVARSWYEAHMAMTPLQRLTHQPTLTSELKQKKWSKLERRASSLMMAALPEQLKEEVVAAKSVSALGILSKAMLLYQPGGLAERTAILSALESPQEATTVSMAITQLRRWVRWKRRATEVGVSLPDSTILVRGLSKLMKRVVASHPDLSFRLSLARNSLLIDTVPNHESVSQYSEHLLAELEQMGHQSKKKEVVPVDPPSSEV